MLSENAKKFIAYLRLIRLHKPIPILLLIFPPIILILSEYYLGIKLDVGVNFDALSLTFKILIGGFCARSLGGIVNDFFDRDIDKNSKRTKNRPFINQNDEGYKIKTNDPILYILSGLLIGTGLITMLSLKFGSILLCLLAVAMTIIYPLTKRFLAIPQLFLGFTYNLGILIAGFEISGSIKISHIIFYVGNIIFTFAYDTIYAAQDKEDDLKNSMHSSVVTFSENWDFITDKAYNLAFAFFLIFGILNILSFGYYISLVISFVSTKFLTRNLRKKKNEEFQKIFELNALLLLIIIFGILTDIALLYFQL